MPPWRLGGRIGRLTSALFIAWTVAMATWLLLYREGADVTCGPEIYRHCQIGLKVTTGLGRPGIALLWSLGVLVLAMTWLTRRRPRPEAVPRAATRSAGASTPSVATGRKRMTRPLPANPGSGAVLAELAAGPRFQHSEHADLLQPYADRDGLVAGYRIEGLLSGDPWRHTTYEAIAPDGRAVALKLLPLRAGAARRQARDFCRRARARASIEHPHLLPIFDWGRLDDRLYLAMGLCKAPTLAELIAAGPLEPEDSLRMLGQLADALEAAHAHGLVHRELAPANVLVTPGGGGHVFLGDFGVGGAAWAGGMLDLAESSDYVAPERLRDEPLTPASNVYSLACILVECLTGSPPYSSELPGMVAYAHASEPPPRLAGRRPDLPAAIDDLVAAAMAKDPRERLESPRWLIAAAASSLGLQSAPPPALDGALGRRAGAGRAALPRSALGLALAVAAVATGALGFTLGRSEDEGNPTGRSPAVDPARLRAERERTDAFRATDLALERLDNRRANERRRLATTRTSRAQAASAARLANAYGAAARAVPREFRNTARIASALNETRQAYRGLVAAARRGSRRRYAIAGREVRRRESDLQRHIARLNQARR